MRVAGADGCKAGWLVVARSGEGWAASILSTAGVLALGARVVGLDMPIGLADAPGPRAADLAARRFLVERGGEGVRAPGSRVFPAPSRAHLGLIPLGYHAANARLPAGQRFTQQAFNIARRIAELDAALPGEGPVHEVHPEVSFAALAGHTLPPKKSPEGRALRRCLLAAEGFDTAALAAALGPRTGRWGEDDLLDACAAAWSAGRIAAGVHGTLRHPPPRDARGKRMAIRY